MSKKAKKADETKLKVIESLVKHCSRGSEWQEAGLLHAIEKVLDDDDIDLNYAGLEKLMNEAARN